MSPLIPRRAASLSVDIPDLPIKAKVLRTLMPKAADKGLEAGMWAATIDISTHVKGLLGGEVLKRRTGRLQRSIHPEVHKKLGRIIGIVGTNVEYAAIHEFGGIIRPKNADGFLAFKLPAGRNAKGQFTRQYMFVREVVMPRRPYMSRGFKERKSEATEHIRSHIMKALNRTLKTGRVVPASERKGVGFRAN